MAIVGQGGSRQGPRLGTITDNQCGGIGNCNGASEGVVGDEGDLATVDAHGSRTTDQGIDAGGITTIECQRAINDDSTGCNGAGGRTVANPESCASEDLGSS